MITLMPHLKIGPYKEGVTIVQIQMPFYPIVRSWTLLSLILYTYPYSSCMFFLQQHPFKKNVFRSLYIAVSFLENRRVRGKNFASTATLMVRDNWCEMPLFQSRTL